MNKKVKLLIFNWRQSGSTRSEYGASEDYDSFTVGKNGVVSIEENIPKNGMELWNYVVKMDDGTSRRVFNPNFVEYFTTENNKTK